MDSAPDCRVVRCLSRKASYTMSPSYDPFNFFHYLLNLFITDCDCSYRRGVGKRPRFWSLLILGASYLTCNPCKVYLQTASCRYYSIRFCITMDVSWSGYVLFLSAIIISTQRKFGQIPPQSHRFFRNLEPLKHHQTTIFKQNLSRTTANNGFNPIPLPAHQRNYSGSTPVTLRQQKIHRQYAQVSSNHDHWPARRLSDRLLWYWLA